MINHKAGERSHNGGQLVARTRRSGLAPPLGTSVASDEEGFVRTLIKACLRVRSRGRACRLRCERAAGDTPAASGKLQGTGSGRPMAAASSGLGWRRRRHRQRHGERQRERERATGTGTGTGNGTGTGTGRARAPATGGGDDGDRERPGEATTAETTRRPRGTAATASRPSRTSPPPARSRR